MLTNAASLWYIALDEATVAKPLSLFKSPEAGAVTPAGPRPEPAHKGPHDGFVTLPVPQVVPLSPQQSLEFEEGKRHYESVSRWQRIGSDDVA